MQTFHLYVSFLLLNCKTCLRWRLRGAMKTMILLSEWDWVPQDTENRTTNQSKDNVYTTGLMGLETGEAAVAALPIRGVFIASKIRGDGLPDDQEVYSP